MMRDATPHSGETRIQLWLRIEERTKPRVYSLIFESASISSLSYWLEISFSAAIATFGLVLNSPAVIIGAMLISPLMGPIMATGLALAANDLYLALKAVTNLIASVAGAVGLAAFIVWLLPFHSSTAEILARTNPNLLDLGVAIFSGLAGSVVVCRGGGGGGVTALPGVAIAVALMPPLCTMGFGFGSGGDMEIVGGAGLLFLTNLVAIVSSAFLVFLLVGMGSAEVRAEMRMVEGDDPFAQRLLQGPLGRLFREGGKVRWRILLLLVLLGSVAVPLRRALVQVTGETISRSAVQGVIQNLVPSKALVSQQVQIGRESIVIRLVSTRNIPPAAIANAEESISRRTGKQVDLSVQAVASKTELAELAARLIVAVPAQHPIEKTLEAYRQEIITRVTPVVTQAWPPEAPIQEFDVALNATGIVCNVKYQAAKELGQIPLAMILRDLRDKLRTPSVELNTVRVTLPRAERKTVTGSTVRGRTSVPR
jgi:uncharacterized hydrophobic protein (TIGR00271 family)